MRPAFRAKAFPGCLELSEIIGNGIHSRWAQPFVEGPTAGEKARLSKRGTRGKQNRRTLRRCGRCG